MSKVHATKIPEFYSGKNVFITGGTGFLGKVLIEKLLRSCPEIGKIYVLVRSKKGMDAKERFQVVLQDQLFDTLKSTNSNQLSKIHPIQGDCKELQLGLSAENYQLIVDTTSVIYHVAASVRFDDSLRDAVLLNTRGTREMAELALKTVNLKIFIHVSTTFCNCVLDQTLNEEIYPAPANWREVISVAENFDSSALAYLTDKYLGPYPNTYTFTKALGEHVVNDLCGGKIPTLIARPSVVVSTHKDPIKGWIDNFNGPVALLIACGKGLMRQSYQDPDISVDYIPVDVTVKGTIVAAWDLALRQQNSAVEVIHCSNSFHHGITLGEVVYLGRTLSADCPLNDSIWVPKGFVTRCRIWAYICTIFFHLIPAMFLDSVLYLMGKKTKLVRLQVKIYNTALQLRYFTWQEWNFKNDKFLANLERILQDDRKDWDYDFRSTDFTEFIKDCMKGARKYLLKESDESLPQAKIHYNRMYWLDKITMFILYSSLFWLVIHLGLIQMFITKITNSFTYLFNRENI